MEQIDCKNLPCPKKDINRMHTVLLVIEVKAPSRAKFSFAKAFEKGYPALRSTTFYFTAKLNRSTSFRL